MLYQGLLELRGSCIVLYEYISRGYDASCIIKVSASREWRQLYFDFTADNESSWVIQKTMSVLGNILTISCRNL